MAYRLSMVPRIAQRFGVHTRPHVIGLCAFFSRRFGILFLVVAFFAALDRPGPTLTLPVSTTGASGSFDSDGLLIDPAAPGGATARMSDTGSVSDLSSTFHGTGLERAVAGAPHWLGYAAVGLALFWLAPLLRRFAEGDPFAPGNAGRLRGIAAAAFVATHVVPLLTPLTVAFALHRLGGSGWSAVWGSPVHTSLVFVLLLFLLAGALDVGRRLQADSEGLV